MLLQSDLKNLKHWSSSSGLTFNVKKCKQQRITRKITSTISTYNINDHQLETTNFERDLGVLVSSNLVWKTQVQHSALKANELLGYIRRNTMFINRTAPIRTLYLSLVRCHFGYASQMWEPQTIELITTLKRTQRRATKYILNLPFSTDVDYKTRLLFLHLLPISYWQEYLDLILFFKISHDLVEISAPLDIHVTQRTTRSSSTNNVKYIVCKCKTTTYQQPVFVRTC